MQTGGKASSEYLGQLSSLPPQAQPSTPNTLTPHHPKPPTNPQALYTANLAPTSTNREATEVSLDTPLDIVLSGCVPNASAPLVKLDAITVTNYTQYEWAATLLITSQRVSGHSSANKSGVTSGVTSAGSKAGAAAPPPTPSPLGAPPPPPTPSAAASGVTAPIATPGAPAAPAGGGGADTMQALLGQIAASQSTGRRRRLYEGALGLASSLLGVGGGGGSSSSSQVLDSTAEGSANQRRRGLQQTGGSSNATAGAKSSSNATAASSSSSGSSSSSSPSGSGSKATNSSSSSSSSSSTRTRTRTPTRGPKKPSSSANSSSTSGNSSSSSSAGSSDLAATTSLTTLAFAIGQNATVGVRAEFKRAVGGRGQRLNGTLQMANPSKAAVTAGRPYVMLSFSNGTSARVVPTCPASSLVPGSPGDVKLLPSPAVLTCAWELLAPLTTPVTVQVVAVLSGYSSPAPMSKVVGVNFSEARSLTNGTCAAVSVNWALDAPPAAAALALSLQPKAAAGARGNPAPSSALQLCKDQVYAWSLRLGPFGAQQCAAVGAGLELVGAAVAVPTNGTQPRQAATAKAKVVISGCRAPAAAGTAAAAAPVKGL